MNEWVKWHLPYDGGLVIRSRLTNMKWGGSIAGYV